MVGHIGRLSRAATAARPRQFHAELQVASRLRQVRPPPGAASPLPRCVRFDVGGSDEADGIMRDDNPPSRSRLATASGLILSLIAGCYADQLPREMRHLGVPRVEAIEVQLLERVTLTPGATVQLPLQLKRNGNEGPITVSLPELPAGVEASFKPEIAAGLSEVEIVLTGSPTLGDREITREVSVCLTMDGQSIDASFSLNLPRVPRPVIEPLSAVFLQPGDAIDLLVPVTRNGYADPLVFAPPAVPAGVVCRLPEKPLQGDSLPVHLEAAETAAEMQSAVLLTTTVYGRPISTPLQLVVARRPFRLPTVPVVTLQPGESRQVEVPIERDSVEPLSRLITSGVQPLTDVQLVPTAFSGPISLTATSPDGAIAVEPVTAAAGSRGATVLVAADPSARPGAVTVGLRAAADHLEATGLLVVRVVGTAATAAELSAAIAAAVAPGMPLRAGGVAGRTTAESRRLLGRHYGQSPESRKAIGRALDWLAAAQAEDGGWQPTGDRIGIRLASHGGAASPHGTDRPTATAAALLPFLAEGITHEAVSATAADRESFAATVGRGLFWLGNRQIEASRQTPGMISETLAGQALGLVAFSEAYAASGDRRLATNAKFAARQLVDRQADGGGWAEGDAVTPLATARAYLALTRARACGVGVSALALRRAEQQLAAAAATSPTSLLSDWAAADWPPGATRTAAWLLARQAAGLRAGGEQLAMLAPAVEADRCSRSVDFLRDTGELLRNLDGESFDRWNAQVHAFLCRRQLRAGAAAGSWDPDDFAGGTDRLHTTALATLCLQVAYRTLPPAE